MYPLQAVNTNISSSTTATVTPASVYTTLFDTVYAATVTVTVAEENELEYVTQTTITTEMKVSKLNPTHFLELFPDFYCRLSTPQRP
jgi:hypothetical protein